MGQKLLRLTVVQGEELLLETIFDASDRIPRSEIWDEAAEKPFAADYVSPLLQPSEGDPLQVQIRGEVKVNITHVEEDLGTAVLTDVLLVRSSPTSDDWRLPPQEILRAKQFLGL